MTGPDVTVTGTSSYCCLGRGKVFARRALLAALDKVLKLGGCEEHVSARAIQARHRRNRLRALFLRKRTTASQFAWVARTVTARLRFLRIRRAIIAAQSYLLMAPVRFGFLALRACAIRIQRWWPWRATMRALRRALTARKAEQVIFERVMAWRQGEACRDPSGEHSIAINEVIKMRARRDAVNKARACLQLQTRNFLFRLGYLRLRDAALKLQPLSRAYVVRRRLVMFRSAVPRFQRRLVGFLVQRRFQALRAAACRVQHFARYHPAVWRRRREARFAGAVKFQSLVRIILARNKVKKLHSLAQEAARIDSCADALFLEVEDLQRNIVAAVRTFLDRYRHYRAAEGLDDDETWVNQTARQLNSCRLLTHERRCDDQ